MSQIQPSRKGHVREATQEKRKGAEKQWKGERNIQAEELSSRNLQWLSSTLIRYGKEQGFTPESRQWIKKRVASEDIASRADDAMFNATWWDPNVDPNTLSDSSSQTSNSPTAAAAAVAAMNGDSLQSLTSSEDLGDVKLYPMVTFEDLLNSVRLIEEYFEEENPYHLEYFRRVAEFNDRLQRRGLSLSTDAPDDVLADAKVIAQGSLVIIPEKGPLLGDINKDVVSGAYALIMNQKKCRVELLYDAFRLVTTELIDLYANDWLLFVENDPRYLELRRIAYEESNTKAASNAQQVAATIPASTNTLSNIGVPQFNKWYPERAPSWSNQGKGYASISLTIHSCHGPMVEHNKGMLYVVIGSGSRILQTSKLTNGDFNLTTTLPVFDTTQFIWVMVGSQGKCIGACPLPMAELIDLPVGDQIPVILRTESEPGLLHNVLNDNVSRLSGAFHATPSITTSNTAAGTSTTTTTGNVHLPNQASMMRASVLVSTQSFLASPRSLSNMNEVVLSWTLSTEPDPCLERVDGFKCIYADETATTGMLSEFIRGKVSKKKKRFSDDNFNLDLTYITPNIIAMGFPSEGTEGVYRNPLKQVQQFFLLRHPHAYRIYNLCSERSYDITKFESRCEHYPFDDHNPPPFHMIHIFCEQVRQFLSESPQNVVSIHCKAGKGRTGTMICAYLIFALGFSAQQALEYYGRMRTSNFQGVTIASQITYVKYYDHLCALLKAGRPGPGPCTLFLEAIRLKNTRKLNLTDLSFTIHHPHQRYDLATQKMLETRKPTTYTCSRRPTKIPNGYGWMFQDSLIDLYEDFLVTFKNGRDTVCSFWLNTRFILVEERDARTHAVKMNPDGTTTDITHVVSEHPTSRTDIGNKKASVVLTATNEARRFAVTRVLKTQMEKASKDKKHKKFDADFHVELIFTLTSTSSQIKMRELEVPNQPQYTQVPTPPGSATRPSSPTK